MNNIYIKINKPLYGTYCYIRDVYIDKAIRNGVRLTIEIPQGTATVDPKWWKETGQIMKKVFKFIDNPMILYGNSVPIKEHHGIIEDNNDNQLSLI